jgi:hexosaminidase
MTRRACLSLTFAATIAGGCAKPAVRTTPAPAPASAPVPAPPPAAAPAPAPAAEKGTAQPAHALVPAPVEFQRREGTFAVTPRTRILATDAAATRSGALVAQLIAPAPNAAIPVEVGSPAPDLKDAIVLALGPASNVPDHPEGYALDVNADRVLISARHPAGLFYGIQTLRQLMPAIVEHEWLRRKPVVIPSVAIRDWPRFTWRGMMLDVSRHFFDVEEVTRLIDLLALHKINRLHLHLADDQGWRVQIDSWPDLTAIGGSSEVGGGAGGFFTKADYAAIVRYAEERFITIVPEIDMPGHINAALVSYPDLNCDGIAPKVHTGIEVGFSALCVDLDLTYKFIDDVVREIAAMTPGPYFHIGGDEVKRLTPAQYAAFVKRAEAIVRRHGKTMIGWDEVAEVTLDPSSIVQYWRPGVPKARIDQTGKAILSPANKIYLDMKYTASTGIGLDWAARSGIEVREAYDWDPATLVPGVEERAILGVEGPLWSETVARRADLDYLAFPRIAGIAEIGWTPQPLRSWDDYRLRLAAQADRWTALGVNFYRSPQVPWKH